MNYAAAFATLYSVMQGTVDYSEATIKQCITDPIADWIVDVLVGDQPAEAYKVQLSNDIYNQMLGSNVNFDENTKWVEKVSNWLSGLFNDIPDIIEPTEPTEPTEPGPTDPTEPIEPTEPAPTEPTEPAPTEPAGPADTPDLIEAYPGDPLVDPSISDPILLEINNGLELWSTL